VWVDVPVFSIAEIDFQYEQTGEIRLLARDMSQRFLLGEKAKDSKSDTKKSKNSESESTGFIGE
jgi:hypothetical protein